jgi:hypothetical protein
MHDPSHDLIAICASPTMAMPSTPADIMTGPARDCGHDSDTARLAVAMRIGCGAAVCSCHVVVTLSGRAGVGRCSTTGRPPLNHHLLGSAPKPSTAPSLLKPFSCCAR